MENTKKTTICITGVTGYLASWIAKIAIEDGRFDVRGTVRDTDSEETKALVDALKVETGEDEQIELYNADLLVDDSWDEAFDGCSYVIHTASPYFIDTPEDPENTLIKPTVEGTKNVLSAALKTNVKRVIYTSTAGTVLDWTGGDRKLKETYFATIQKTTFPYFEGKIKAEELAWKYIDEHKNLELITINPSFMCGPVIYKRKGPSVDFVEKLLTGEISSAPQIFMNCVDVRDVARAHIAAMFVEYDIIRNAGNRYILNEGIYKTVTIGEMLHREFGEFGYTPPTSEASCALFWIASWFDNDTNSIYAQWNIKEEADGSRAESKLGINYTQTKTAILDMAYSMIDHGLVIDLIKNKK